MERALLLVLGGALILRLVLIPVTHAHGYTSDEQQYIQLATLVAGGGEFVDFNGTRSVRAPLYPVALSLIVSWPWWIPVSHLVGALLGTLLVYFGYLFARGMVTDEGALMAAVILAVHPGLAIYAGLLQTETLYAVLLLGCLLVAVRLPDDPRMPRGLALGILGGLAALTRSVAVGFFPLLLLVLLWLGRAQGKRIAAVVGVAAIAWCVTLAPWMIRNYALFQALVPVSSGGGSALLMGNNPYATGGLKIGAGFDRWYSEELRAEGGGGANEVERSKADGRIALRYIAAEPLHAVVLALKKTQIFWVYPAVHTDSDLRVQLPAVAADLLLMLGVAIGLAVLKAPRTPSVVALAALLFFWLVQTVLHSEARFRLPVVPLLAAYWGAGIVALRNRKQVFHGLRDSRRTTVAVAAVLIVLLVYGVTAWMFVTGRI